MPRLKDPCLLCLPFVSKKDQDAFWYGMADSGKSGVLEVAKERGIENISEQMVRRHFEYHFPRQAPAQKPWTTEQALEKASELVKRKRNLLEIAFRLGAIDSHFAGLALYWNGQEDKMISAEKNAARDLRQLLNDHFLFRVYPDNLPGKNIWLANEVVSVPLPVFFLGINGRAWARKSSGYHLNTKKDVVSSVEDLESWAKVLGTIAPNKFIGALLQQLPEIEPPMARSGKINGVPVVVDCENFFNYKFINIKLEDPLQKSTILRSSGIGALTLYDKELQPFLAPFIYNYDDGRRAPEKIIADVCSQQTLSRAEKITSISKQIHPASIIPSLIVANNEQRMLKIKAAAKKQKGNVSSEAEAFILSSENLSDCLKKRKWEKLFANSRNPEALIPVLIRNYQRKPIRSEKLQLIGSRKEKN